MSGLRTWREEFIGIPLALLAFFFAAELIRSFDPTAGVYDTGVFLIILFSLVRAMCFSGFAWLAVRWVFPSIWKFFQNEFENEFNKLEGCKRIYISLLIYFVFFFFLVLLAVNP